VRHLPDNDGVTAMDGALRISAGATHAALEDVAALVGIPPAKPRPS
jgi:hypothetical protein